MSEDTPQALTDRGSRSDPGRWSQGRSAAVQWSPVLLIASVSCTLAWLIRGAGWSGPANLVLLAAALGLHGAWWLRGAARWRWSMRYAVVAVGVVLCAAALVPLHHSRDLYLYNIYGRAVAQHHVSPYTHTPADLDDPTIEYVAEAWHGQRSMYGPGFLALATGVAGTAGESKLFVRLAWQLITASAAVGAVVLVARRTRDPVAVLALGCSPVLLAAVNDAHNDVLVGLAVLATVLLAEDRHYLLAACVGALAITTKVPAVLLIGVVGLWVIWRRGWRDAARFGLPLATLVTAAYLAVGGAAALSPLGDSSGDDSRFAMWQQLRDQRMADLLDQGIAWRDALGIVRDQFTTWSLVIMAASLLVVLWRFRRAEGPDEPTAIAAVVMFATATYVMAWYPPMVLPLAALAWRSRTSVLVQVQAAFLLFAYAEGPGKDPTTWLGLLIEERSMWPNLAILAAVLLWAKPCRCSNDHQVHHLITPSVQE